MGLPFSFRFPAGGARVRPGEFGLAESQTAGQIGVVDFLIARRQVEHLLAVFEGGKFVAEVEAWNDWVRWWKGA